MSEKRGPWKIEQSEEKYRNDHLYVREDQVRQPDGKPGTYAVVYLVPGVVVLPVDREDNVYLTRQFRYSVGHESLEALGGGINDGEKPLEAAKREAHEELGIKAAEWIEIGTMDLDTSIVHCKHHLFIARGIELRAAEPEGTETIQRVKLPFNAALDKVRQNEITHNTTCVLLLRAQDYLK